MMSGETANKIVGRVLSVRGLPYTVQSASTTGAVCVWDPQKQEVLVFDTLATFENWAYGKPVPSA